MIVNLLKSLIHNIGVVIVGFIFAFLCTRLDSFLGISDFKSLFAISVGCLLLTVGFFIRVWATFYFYEHQMKVISLAPQKTLITSGPFGFSRNPLYLEGNVFIFFGSTLLFASPAGLFLTVINIILVDFMIRREERQLERSFGKEWILYKKRVRRWL